MIFFELFYVFFLIGLFTFGGGYAMIPMIQEQVVDRGWISSNALSDFIAISESTPGPFAINIATFVGSETAGIFGSICATVGVILPSFIIILIVAYIMNKFLNNKYVRGALDGVRPVILALILSTAIVFLVKLALYSGNPIYSQTIAFDSKSITLLLMVVILMFVYKKVRKKSLNPIAILGICAVLGIFIFIN